MPPLYSYIPPGAADSPSTYTEEEKEKLPPTSPPPDTSMYAAPVESQYQPGGDEYLPAYDPGAQYGMGASGGDPAVAWAEGQPTDPYNTAPSGTYPSDPTPAPAMSSGSPYTSGSSALYGAGAVDSFNGGYPVTGGTQAMGFNPDSTVGPVALPPPNPAMAVSPGGGGYLRQSPSFDWSDPRSLDRRSYENTRRVLDFQRENAVPSTQYNWEAAEPGSPEPQKRRNTDGTGTLYIPSLGNPWMDAIEDDRRRTGEYLGKHKVAPLPPTYPLASDYPLTRTSYTPQEPIEMDPSDPLEAEIIRNRKMQKDSERVESTLSTPIANIPSEYIGPQGWLGGLSGARDKYDEATEAADRDMERRGLKLPPARPPSRSPADLVKLAAGYSGYEPDMDYSSIERTRAAMPVVKSRGRKIIQPGDADTPGIRSVYGEGRDTPPPSGSVPPPTKTPFSPSVDRAAKYMIDKKFINDDGSWTDETLDTNTREGYIKDGKWELKASEDGVIRPEDVGKEANWRHMLGAEKRMGGKGEGDSDSDDGGELADNPIPSTASSVTTDSSSSSSGGGGSSGGNSGGGGRSSSSGGGGSRRGSSWRDYGDDGGSAPSWEDFLRDFDGDGDMDERDEKRARKMAMMRGKRVRGRRRGRMSTLPNIPPSPLRTSILGALSEGLGREISGWPENQGRKR